MGSKGGGGGGTTVVQFAPYIEAMHTDMLAKPGESLAVSVVAAMNTAAGQSPYNVTTVTAEAGFVGTGNLIGSRTALFDLFKTLMQDKDVDSLWTQMYDKTVQGPEVSEAVSAQGALIQDEIDERIMPKFLAGMRDINSVMSSAFIVGKALIADSQVKMVANFSATLKLKQFDAVNERWAKKLAWDTSMVTVYSDLMKLYYTTRFDAESRDIEYKTKHALWNLSLFEYGRSIVGALNGASAASPQNLPSQTAKGIAGAMAGAGAGASVGSSISKEGGAAYGAAAGGVLGFAAAFL